MYLSSKMRRLMTESPEAGRVIIEGTSQILGQQLRDQRHQEIRDRLMLGRGLQTRRSRRLIEHLGL